MRWIPYLLVLFTTLIASCAAPPPEVGDIQAQPSTSIVVGNTASLTVTASGTDLEFEWTAVRGTLSDATQPSVIYTAPLEPGTDTVTVRVTSGGSTTVRNITFEVIKPTPTPTSTPTLTPIPTSTPTPTLTPTPTTTLTPSPTQELRCNNPLITKYVFPQLEPVESEFPFYGPLDDPNFRCQGVFDLIFSEPVAVMIDYKNVGDNSGYWGIGIPVGFDASGFRELCFWAYSKNPAQSFYLRAKDTNNSEKRLLISLESSNEWTQSCKPLSDFEKLGVELSQIENFNLGFDKDSGNATIWVDDFELK